MTTRPTAYQPVSYQNPLGTGRVPPFAKAYVGRIRCVSIAFSRLISKNLLRASPVFFGPGTLWRTWGTRPVPMGLC